MTTTADLQQYRKKPVVIEAKRFTDLDSYLAIVDWMKESGDTHALANEVRYSTPIMLLQTLEGTMSASPGDWIIRGVKGEFYPCKPDIFAATYDVAGTSSTGAILAEIADERAAQDAKWGEQNHPDADPVILARLNTVGMYGTPWAVAQRLAQEYEIPTAARAKLICQTEAASAGATWIGIAVEELAEALEAAATGDTNKLRTELLQVAAVAVAWVEAIDRRTASAANHG